MIDNLQSCELLLYVTCENKCSVHLPWQGRHTFQLPDWSVLQLSVFSKIEDYVGEILVFWTAGPAWQETSGKRNPTLLYKSLYYTSYDENELYFPNTTSHSQAKERNTNLRCDGRNIFFNVGTPSFHFSNSRWNCRVCWGRNCGVVTNCWACTASAVILLFNLRVYQLYGHSTVSFVLCKGIWCMSH